MSWLSTYFQIYEDLLDWMETEFPNIERMSRDDVVHECLRLLKGVSSETDVRVQTVLAKFVYKVGDEAEDDEESQREFRRLKRIDFEEREHIKIYTTKRGRKHRLMRGIVIIPVDSTPERKGYTLYYNPEISRMIKTVDAIRIIEGEDEDER